MRLEGVERWADPSDDWTRRGVEKAANAISEELMKEPVVGLPEGCRTLEAGFRILTRTDSLASCRD